MPWSEQGRGLGAWSCAQGSACARHRRRAPQMHRAMTKGATPARLRLRRLAEFGRSAQRLMQRPGRFVAESWCVLPVDTCRRCPLRKASLRFQKIRAIRRLANQRSAVARSAATTAAPLGRRRLCMPAFAVGAAGGGDAIWRPCAMADGLALRDGLPERGASLPATRQIARANSRVVGELETVPHPVARPVAA